MTSGRAIQRGSQNRTFETGAVSAEGKGRHRGRCRCPKYARMKPGGAGRAGAAPGRAAGEGRGVGVARPVTEPSGSGGRRRPLYTYSDGGVVNSDVGGAGSVAGPRPVRESLLTARWE